MEKKTSRLISPKASKGSDLIDCEITFSNHFKDVFSWNNHLNSVCLKSKERLQTLAIEKVRIHVRIGV